jgi:hypothetical protein
MPSPNFLIGAGLAATVAFLLWPEIIGGMKHATSNQREDQRRFERQARAAQDVTATGDDRDDVSREEDERISAQKDYRGDPDWRARNSSQRNVVCEWTPIDWEWEEYRCHDYFERPVYQLRAPRKQQARNQRRQLVRYGPNVTACRHGGCPYNGG